MESHKDSMTKEQIERGRYITAKESSIYLSLSVGTIYNLVCSGKLKKYKIGNKSKGGIRFTIEDLDLFVGRRYDNKTSGQ